VFKKFGLQEGYDETRPADYTADPEPAPASARKAKPVAKGKASRGSAIPWSLDAAADEAPAAAEAAAGEASAAAVEDDATIVFEIPDSLAGRSRSRERSLRRK
jgi:hypothetical protein